MHGRVRHPVNKSICYKGVEISSVWKEFVVFLHDMGECPNGYSLDRIDSTKGYSADNCRWIPLEEQASNTSKNRKIVYNGIEACVSTHAKSKGLHPDLVFDRLNKLGWAIDKALDTPKKKNYHN